MKVANSDSFETQSVRAESKSAENKVLGIGY